MSDNLNAVPMAAIICAAQTVLLGPRHHKSAHCRLIAADSGDPEVDARTRRINDLCSTNPRKGHATALMCDVCGEADAANFMLILEARPFGNGMSQEQLEKWYQGFGFWVIEQEGPRLMARMPNSTPTVMQ